MSRPICTNCKLSISQHTGKINEEGDIVSLCYTCMADKELGWNDDGYFVDKYHRCSFCSGYESWCETCQTYSRNCCVDYGTCQCS